MKGFRILVVEDEVLLQRVMEDAARLIGLPCEVVRTGQEALERLQMRRYDLLIQDVRLPDISGAAVVQTAREIDPAIPVILITAYAVDAEVQQAVQQGVDAVLFKPFDIDTLLATVRHLLLKRHGGMSTHAVVQMPAPMPIPPSWLEIPPVGGFVTLQLEGRRLMGQVRAGNELECVIETPHETGAIPAWVQVELTGRDALYHFRARLIEHRHREDSDWWRLKRPGRVRRIQRRREPRLPATGHVVVSAVGRLLRTVEGTLIDLSAHGVALKLPVELNKGTPLHLLIEWQEPEATYAFRSEGFICHTLALTEAGRPVYLSGIQLMRVPRAIRSRIRERLHQQLMAGIPP